MKTMKLWRIAFMMLTAFSIASCGSDEPRYADPEAHEKTVQLNEQYGPLMVGNEYNVDGDWLATRWRADADAKYDYEWWDIDYIRGNEMKWSALREDANTGKRFKTTFTWKRIQ